MGEKWKVGEYALKRGTMLVRIDSIREQDGSVSGGSYVSVSSSGEVYGGGCWSGGCSEQDYHRLTDPKHMLIVRVFEAHNRVLRAKRENQDSDFEVRLSIAALDAVRQAKMAAGLATSG